ncbi:KH domain-containing protein [candidate division WOR-3 bacterium]|nr:KH domain-containing protein [candidate division WOR-3 bacterium]
MVNHVIEVEAENLEEAIKKGLEELSLKEKEQMDWEVLATEEGGAVRLKVKKKEETPKEEIPEEEVSEEKPPEEAPKSSPKEELVRKEVNTLLEKLGTTGKIRIEKEEDRLYVDIRTKDMDGMLIGKSGKNLESFQHILSRIIHSKDNSIELVIDIAGYRRKKERTLSTRARAFAYEVKRSKREYIFQPLPPSLRRSIHLAVSDIQGVRTYTIGDTELKKVVIAPSREH